MTAHGWNMAIIVTSQSKTNWILLSVVVVALIGVFIAMGATPNVTERTDTIGVDVGNMAPDFETVSVTDAPIRLSDLRGQVVILNFWATWCGPCRIEMPIFQQIHTQFQDQPVTILAVNNREPATDIIRFRDQIGLTFPLAMDESGRIQDLYAISGYPITFVIDTDGRIIKKHFGVFTNRQANELREFLAEHSVSRVDIIE